MKKSLFVVLIAVSHTIWSQFANNWIVGSNLGINFNNNPPTTFTGGICGNADNSTAVSNSLGVLQFYTDGMTVRDANNNIMPNGNGLTGSFTGGQCAIIVPVPCSGTKFVIFHVTDFSNPGYLKYTVVDMSLNGGLGDVIVAQKNVSLGTGWTEKLCAYYNSANNCYWVVSHKWGTNEFVSFKVDVNSIATTSVVSAIGSVHNCGSVGAAHDAMGQLTISQDGSKIANALTCQDKFEIFTFNQNTGAVTAASVAIAGNGGNAWATAFSPNNQKLYVNSIFGQSIYQYDLSSFTSSAVAASIYTVVTTGVGGYNFGYMELAPDGKIYIPRPNTQWFSAINAPNLGGVACAFNYTALSTGGANAQWGTNRVAYNIPPNGQNSMTLNLNPDMIICRGQTAQLTSSASGGFNPYSYSWSNGATTSSCNVTPSVTTTYSMLLADASNCTLSAITTVSVMLCDNLKESASSNSFVYPNPFQNEINITTNSSLSDIAIFNSIGEKIEFQRNDLRKLKIDNLPRGIYFLELKFEGGGYKIIKLVKE